MILWEINKCIYREYIEKYIEKCIYREKGSEKFWEGKSKTEETALPSVQNLVYNPFKGFVASSGKKSWLWLLFKKKE